MMTFTDKRIYGKGICSVELKDPATGEILAQSDKFSEGNISFSVNDDPLRAGLGNAVATIIGSDSTMSVSFTRADTDLMTKMMSVGAKVDYNAVAPLCQTIKATGTSLTLDVTSTTPTAQYGYSDVFCYIQTAGEASTLSMAGKPYPLDPETGAITGFTAEAGKTYHVWYFAKKAYAKVGVIGGNFDGKIVHFTVQLALYTNVSTNSEGNRWGWRYIVVPNLRLSADGANLTGSQNNYDNTVITGQGIVAENAVVPMECNDCGGVGTIAYVIDVPDAESDEVAGVLCMAGAVTLDKSTTAPIDARLVMKNGTLVVPSPASLIKYTVDAGTATGTTVSQLGVVTAGDTAGTGTITLAYPAAGDAKYTAKAILTVEEGD